MIDDIRIVIADVPPDTLMLISWTDELIDALTHKALIPESEFRKAVSHSVVAIRNVQETKGA